MIPKGTRIGRVNSVMNSIPSISFDIISDLLKCSISDTMLLAIFKTAVVMVFSSLNINTLNN